MIAASETYDGQHGKAIIGRGLAVFDSKSLTQMGPDLLVAHDPATHAVADHDHMAADRLAKVVAEALG